MGCRRGRSASGLRGTAVGVVLAAAAVAGCARAVDGAPVAAPPAPATATERARGSVPAAPHTIGPAPNARDPNPPTPVIPDPTPQVAAPSAAGAVPGRGGPAPAPSTLVADVLTDECLLDATQLTALLGRPVRKPAQSVVRREDGSHGSACCTGPVDGDGGPVVAVNVYRVATGTPAGFVRAAGGRLLPGSGPVAAVLDTPAGSTLQVAGRRFLVAVAVQGREPTDRAWRTAARAAVARLPA